MTRVDDPVASYDLCEEDDASDFFWYSQVLKLSVLSKARLTNNLLTLLLASGVDSITPTVVQFLEKHSNESDCFLLFSDGEKKMRGRMNATASQKVVDLELRPREIVNVHFHNRHNERICVNGCAFIISDISRMTPR